MKVCLHLSQVVLHSIYRIFSTFGVTGNKWRLAAKATCTTMASSFTGGIVAIVMSYYQSGGKVEVLATINGVLGALVGVTGKSGLMQSF